MRRFLLVPTVLALLLAPAQTAHGQSLASKLEELLLFGDCGGRLCLLLDPLNNHAEHYTADAAAAGDLVIGFLQGAIGLSLGNLPFASANSGTLLTVQDGNLVQTPVSGGPFYAERAVTLGQGRLFLSANVSGVSLSEVRGIPTDELVFTFTHEDDNTVFGDRDVENDLINVNMTLDVSVIAASFMAAYGVSDRVDVAVQIPVVRASLDASSQGFVDENTPGSGNHRFFDTSGPVSGVSRVSGSKTGIGDIGVRVKANVYNTDSFELGLLADARLPTGSEDDFLGSGGSAVRGLGLVSGRIGTFAPHLNAGLARVGGLAPRTSFLSAIGFDMLLGPTTTFAADLLANVELSDSELMIPSPADFDAGRSVMVPRTNLPDQKDHLVDVSLGLKMVAGEGVRIALNSLVPLGDGGMYGDVLWTLGVEVLR